VTPLLPTVAAAHKTASVASTAIENRKETPYGAHCGLLDLDYSTSALWVESGEGVVSSGTMVQVLDYFPFGSERVDLTYSGSPSQRTFIGEMKDQETDLNYLNARYYESARGQFLSIDPVFWELDKTEDGKKALRDPQLQNSYSYARNNPLTNKDPEGRFTIDANVGISRGLVGGSFGVRVELFSGWGYQGYYSTSVGPQYGGHAQLRIDPTGTLVPAGDYTSRDIFGAFWGGLSYTKEAEFNPSSPLSLKQDPRSGWGLVLAVGPAAGATQQYTKYGQPNYFGSNTTNSGFLQSFYQSTFTQVAQAQTGGSVTSAQSSALAGFASAFAPSNAGQAAAVQKVISAFTKK
jgi:RHS repeat-associated protein